MSDKKIGIIGSGSWATAIVKIVSNTCNSINWYFRNAEDIEFIKKYQHNPRYLTSVDFDLKKLNLYNDVNECVKNSDIVILAIPSAFVHASISSLDKIDLKNKLFFSAIKGIVPEYHLIVGEY